MTRTMRLVHVAVGIWLLPALLAAGAADPESDKHDPSATDPPGGTVQETCPVMVGNKINPNIYSDYKGKRVYFCCLSCKETFDASPERYLGRLPQFATHEHAEEHAHGLAGARLVKPLGIVALALLVLTAGVGLFRRLKPRVLVKWHKRLACATVLAALCHLTLVLLFH